VKQQYFRKYVILITEVNLFFAEPARGFCDCGNPSNNDHAAGTENSAFVTLVSSTMAEFPRHEHPSSRLLSMPTCSGGGSVAKQRHHKYISTACPDTIHLSSAGHHLRTSIEIIFQRWASAAASPTSSVYLRQSVRPCPQKYSYVYLARTNRPWRPLSTTTRLPAFCRPASTIYKAKEASCLNPGR
jgi:hypothetical protein